MLRHPPLLAHRGRTYTHCICVVGPSWTLFIHAFKIRSERHHIPNRSTDRSIGAGQPSTAQTSISAPHRSIRACPLSILIDTTAFLPPRLRLSTFKPTRAAAVVGSYGRTPSSSSFPQPGFGARFWEWVGLVQARQQQRSRHGGVKFPPGPSIGPPDPVVPAPMATGAGPCTASSCAMRRGAASSSGPGRNEGQKTAAGCGHSAAASDGGTRSRDKPRDRPNPPRAHLWGRPAGAESWGPGRIWGGGRPLVVNVNGMAAPIMTAILNPCLPTLDSSQASLDRCTPE